MSIELQEPKVEAARAALDEFHATQDECNEFFGDVFDQIHAMSLELFARHKCLESNTDKDQRKPAAEGPTVASSREFQRAIKQLQRLSASMEDQIARLAAVTAELADARVNRPP